jgi:hypothetical protein
MLGTAGILAGLGGCTGKAPLGQLAEASAKGRGGSPKGTIDRRAVVGRHHPQVRSADQAAVVSLGNGRFAFNVDCTGLQTLHAEYKTIPLSTLSHWGWHSVPVPEGVNLENLQYRMVDFYGRKVPYATSGGAAGSPQSVIFNYLRENPHRLGLGRVRFLLDGKPIAAAQLSDIDQVLDLYAGVVTSRFSLGGERVEVITCCHADSDGFGARITSPLVARGRLGVEIAFGYGSRTFGGDGVDWTKPDAHRTTLYQDQRAPGQVTFNRELDATRYGVRAAWTGAAANLAEVGPHTYVLTPTAGGGGETLELVMNFDAEPFRTNPLFRFDEARRSSTGAWAAFWENGAAIDFSKCTDPRAPELERRVVLSQYLTAIHCAGEWPSQETGLLCNSWFGKFHMEMHWWHSVHFTVWGRQKLFGRSMLCYTKFLDSSRQRARRQGFEKGARWPKMTAPDGVDSPSSVGPMLLWQQPHPIYFAELAYRDDPTPDTLKRWRDIVVETAAFMAVFVHFDEKRGKYVLGPMIKAVQENNPTETTLNPTYEITAWRFGLTRAQQWLERMGQPRNPEWDHVLQNLAPAPVADGVYQLQENTATFSKEWAWEHPALLGAYGVLPGDGIDPQIMAETVRRVRSTWDFTRVWGWDFPMCAMAAVRTNQPELAIDFLTMEAPMNRYLANGGNFQRANVPAYFPGNGGILATIGMMAGGWTGGPKTPLPGFPKNGQWNVLAEGFGEWI